MYDHRYGKEEVRRSSSSGQQYEYIHPSYFTQSVYGSSPAGPYDHGGPLPHLTKQEPLPPAWSSTIDYTQVTERVGSHTWLNME